MKRLDYLINTLWVVYVIMWVGILVDGGTYWIFPFMLTNILLFITMVYRLLNDKGDKK